MIISILQKLFLPSGRVSAVRMHKKRLHETGPGSFTSYSPTTELPDSRLSEAGDVFQLISPMLQAVAGVIPVAGTPLKAAVDSLLYIIQIIDVGRLAPFRSIPSDFIPDNQAKQGRS